jgi:hypothetical protein
LCVSVIDIFIFNVFCNIKLHLPRLGWLTFRRGSSGLIGCQGE